jgi:hypothetical protein
VYLDISKLFSKVKNREGEYSLFDMRIVDAFKSKTVEDKFEKYNSYINQSPIYFIASVLDPRIKGTFIEVDYIDGKSKLEEVRQTIHKLYPAQRPVTPADTTGAPVTSSTYEYQLLRRAHKTSMPMSDIDQYFDTPIVPWDQKEDPNWVLSWWKANAVLFPIMSQVARDYLAVPPAEVDVERLFSTGRDLLGLRRHCMAPETMKAVLLSRNEYKKQHNV